MKINEFLNEISKKIDLFIKRLNKKRKIYLEDEISKIDFLSGEKVEKISPNSYVINLKKAFQKITEAKHKLGLTYVYKKKNGSYIGANTLALNLIYEALKDYYGDSIFILTDNKANLALFIYDTENYKIIKKDNDYQLAKDDFFQGLQPLEVNIYDAIYLVTQKVGKTILYLLMSVILITGIIFFLSKIQNVSEEEIVNIPEYKKEIKKNKKEITQDEFNKVIPYTLAKILANNYFISKLFNNKFIENKAVILNKIYYKQYSVEYISLIPLEGFKYNGKVYVKKVKYTPSIDVLWDMYQENIINKSSLKCENQIKQYTDNVTYVEESGKYKIYKLQNTIKPQKFTQFISNLFGCPVIIEGKTNYDYLDDEVKNDLLIKIYY